MVRALCCVVLALAAPTWLATQTDASDQSAVGVARARALGRTFSAALGSGRARDTPITRVVNLLKEMATTLQKEMDEDEALNHKLGCWCNDNEWEKKNAIEDGESSVETLESKIEQLTARGGELRTTLKETREKLAADKAALAAATAEREQQLKAFHGSEADSIQALENLKAAIVVLSKHHGAALPQLSLDEFLRSEDANGPTQRDLIGTKSSGIPHGFLQNDGDTSRPGGWSKGDMAAVQHALKSASSLLQQHHGEGYYPSYTTQSGEIMGVLKQLEEEMTADLTEAQKTEMERAAAFAELRAAKTAEIKTGEKLEERKEDELATTDNDLAEAKEDLGQTQVTLAENQKFMVNLKKTCAEADKNFADRKHARLEEIKAVSETINILMQDDARDAFSGTFNAPSMLQFSSQVRYADRRRWKAAIALRRAGAKSHNDQLSNLATVVELDAFTKVKQAIDNMIAMLKVQQEDEVKKMDWCKAELQENEMTTMETKDLKSDLEAKSAGLEATVKRLGEEIKAANSAIYDLQVSLQRASEDRKNENMDFQKTVADQTKTRETLELALDRLAKYYDSVAFAQTRGAARQTPPVPQMEYKPSAGSKGAMQMIEKLIYDTKEVTAESRKSESEAQAAYEQLVADTNESVLSLQREVASKMRARGDARKENTSTEADISDAVKELAGLAKTNADLHTDCDYALHNFSSRQKARAEEIEALQQAKQILNGADLSA